MSKKDHAKKLSDTKLLLDSVAKYFESIASGPVTALSSVPSISKSLPMDPIDFSEILKTIEKSVYPNNLHWQHPMFFSYFPSSISWESIQGTILAKALGSVAFTKSSCPIGNEIEMIVSDWMAEMLKLPSYFFHFRGPGGGLTYGSASEAVLTAMACSRMQRPGKVHVMYTSNQSHFSVEKAARILGMQYRLIPGLYDENAENYPMNIPKLLEQIAKDKAEGLTPTFICGTVGTTNVGATDDIKKIGEIAGTEKMWFHIDAAYAGSLCILPELRNKLDGVELCTSLNVNSSKMVMTGMDSSHMWVKETRFLTDVLSQNASYLGASQNIDFKNWQLPLGRDVKAFKLWLVIQQFGVSGIQKWLRQHIEAGKVFEGLIRSDSRFEIVARRDYGLVCFRVKGDNQKTDSLIKKLGESTEIYMLGSSIYGKSIVRLSPFNCYDDFSNIKQAFQIVSDFLD